VTVRLDSRHQHTVAQWLPFWTTLYILMSPMTLDRYIIVLIIYKTDVSLTIDIVSVVCDELLHGTVNSVQFQD